MCQTTTFLHEQTGSGKTYTITGGGERYTDRGIIPRSISMIFNEFRSKSGMEFKAYISYLELYNEQGYDLLDNSAETKALEELPKVVMLEDEHGNFHLKNLSLHAALTEEDALNLLFRGESSCFYVPHFASHHMT
jgi:kinesin family protein 6/9